MPRKPKPVAEFSNVGYKAYINKHFKKYKKYERQFYLCTTCNNRYWIDIPENYDLPKIMKDNLGSDCGHSFYYRHVKF